MDGALANAYVRVDRAKVLREGRAAAGRLLVELQVRKSTADGAGAREFYTALTEPFPGWDGELRDLVLRKKLVRPSRSRGRCSPPYPRVLPSGADVGFGAAPEDLRAAEHVRRERRGRAQGVPAHAGRRDRELHRAQALNLRGHVGR